MNEKKNINIFMKCDVNNMSKVEKMSLYENNELRLTTEDDDFIELFYFLINSVLLSSSEEVMMNDNDAIERSFQYMNKMFKLFCDYILR